MPTGRKAASVFGRPFTVADLLAIHPVSDTPASLERTLSSLHRADLTLTGESWGGSAGRALSGAGDLDADGRADLLIGANGEDVGGSSSGAAYLFLMAPRY